MLPALDSPLIPHCVKSLFQAARLPFIEKPKQKIVINHHRDIVKDAVMSLFRMAIAYGGYRTFEKALGTVSLSSAWNNKLATVVIGAGQWFLLSGPSLLITVGATALKKAGPELFKAFATRSFTNQTHYAVLGASVGLFLLSSWAKNNLASIKYKNDYAGKQYLAGLADVLIHNMIAYKVANYFYPK